MTLDLDRDQLVSLWRYLEKQPMTADDQERIESLSGELFDALSSDKPRRRNSPRKPQPTTAQTNGAEEETNNVNNSPAPSAA